ncbi:Sir2 family NAD-dependent protein deacetylase [Aestuariivirga sp.]|uniref:SIR2 family NAD-dependent protein deacylase n=1 Tax=Aestuariivirga sp. TaxID=2650926 RepID=UPI0025B7D6BF|nr:Sir2 family NAD-dependent protein deacetylase [Aestuariivirga sp.]MCA3554064.1 Sir2 family NAD-dependent protein deacetylase [Aestuariivirga sp.]
MVQRARRAVVFTGAGISTECGIPDFRSPGGFWTRYKPIDYSEFLASEDTRIEAWRRFLMIRETIGKAEPGPSHRAVAQLAERGHVATVITQNIDGLHQASGIPAQRIIEIHGNGTYAKCLTCGLRHEIGWVKDTIEATGRPPRCTACGGIVKSATISFGQAMPEQEMADARAATLNADLFIAIGSSLQVFPAAGFPVLAKQNRTPMVILNREETGLDGLADLVIHADSGPVLCAVMDRIRAA